MGARPDGFCQRRALSYAFTAELRWTKRERYMDLFASAGRLCSPIGQPDRSGGETCGISSHRPRKLPKKHGCAMSARTETPREGPLL